MSATSPGDAGDWAHTPERSNAPALRLMTWFALACGRPVARLLLYPIALYFMLFAPTACRHSRQYLERALGRPPRRGDVFRHLHAFAAVTLDRVYLLRGHLDLFDITVLDAAVADAVLADRSGAFLVGAHVGSFEVLRSVGKAHANLRVALVMYSDNARLVNGALEAIAPGMGPTIISLGRPGSMLAVRDWLDSGGVCGMLADRVLPGESMRGQQLAVSFLGRSAVFGDGPFRLAALLRRRVVFMAGIYLGGNRYEVRFQTLADFSGAALSAAERDRVIADAVLAYARCLESICRDHPENWFNFHDFWLENEGSARA